MFTGITNHTGVLATAMMILIGGAIVHGGAAAAGPNQDQQFLALLEEKEIPAIENVSRVIAAAPEDLSQARRRHAGGRDTGRAD